MKVYLVQNNYAEEPYVFPRVFATREIAEKSIRQIAFERGYEEVIEVEVEN